MCALADEPDEQGGGQLLVAEDSKPHGEREVRGRDRRTAHLGDIPLTGCNAEFVDVQDNDPQVALVQAGVREFAAGLDQIARETKASRGRRLAASSQRATARLGLPDKIVAVIKTVSL